tara:strand:+ start:607 stop:1059 length:453 start_codon:yes stop_codon:yes gene_type:complete
MLKNTIAIVLISLGLFSESLLGYTTTIKFGETTPEVLRIKKPSAKAISSSSNINDIVTDKNDRIKLAIFNYQFANNVISYETTVQKANDVYTLAAKNFFGTELAGKYEGLSEMIISLIEGTTTNDDHVLTRDEKQELHDKFSAVAWNLLN